MNVAHSNFRQCFGLVDTARMALEWNTMQAETEGFDRHRRQRPRDSHPRPQYKYGYRTVHLATVQTSLKVRTDLPLLPHFRPGNSKSESQQILIQDPKIYADFQVSLQRASPLQCYGGVICYSGTTSTRSPSFCVTAFSASLTNLADLLPVT